jgi:hypothetical protein
VRILYAKVIGLLFKPFFNLYLCQQAIGSVQFAIQRNEGAGNFFAANLLTWFLGNNGGQAYTLKDSDLDEVKRHAAIRIEYLIYQDWVAKGRPVNWQITIDQDVNWWPAGDIAAAMKAQWFEIDDNMFYAYGGAHVKIVSAGKPATWSFKGM